MQELQTTRFELGSIETNLDEVELAVTASLKKYQGLQIQESDLADAKKMRSDLNGLATSINTWRIEKEREFMAPFQAKKDQCNKIVKLIKETSSEIDTQVKDYEAKADDAKRQRIEEWWTFNGAKSISIDKVWDKKFLNKSCSESSWQNALTEKKSRISNDIAGFAKMIDPAYPDATDWLLKDYLENMDFGTTLADWEREKESRKHAEEMKELMARQNTEKQAQEAQTAKQEESHMPEPKASESAEQPASDEEPATYWAEFRIENATRQQMVLLAEAMQRIGLEMHVLKNADGSARKGH